MFCLFLIQATSNKSMRGVELTPLPCVPGGRIVKYLGNYNFFLIRESTSVKEVKFFGKILYISP